MSLIRLQNRSEEKQLDMQSHSSRLASSRTLLLIIISIPVSRPLFFFIVVVPVLQLLVILVKFNSIQFVILTNKGARFWEDKESERRREMQLFFRDKSKKKIQQLLFSVTFFPSLAADYRTEVKYAVARIALKNIASVRLSDFSVFW